MPSRHNLITISDHHFSPPSHHHFIAICIPRGASARAAHASSQELWQLSGGVFNVDDVLQTMVLGLEEDLEERRLDRDERRLEAGV